MPPVVGVVRRHVVLSRFTTPSGRARAAASEEGLTLVEVLIAVFVLTIAVLALASTAAASLTSLRTSRERQQATSAASAAIEDVRTLDYSEIGHPPGEVTESTDPDFVTGTDPAHFAHDGDEQEELVVSASGEVSPHRWTSDDGRLTIRIFVTWYDDDDPSSPTGRNAKRLTAIATWVDPQTGPGEVRQSTIVAAASRGLPVPRFEITPDELERHAEVGGRVCFTHLLRNTGASDSYDWELLNPAGNPATYVNAHTMKLAGWEAQVWFGEPQYKDNDDPDTTADNLWRDTTANQRLDSPWEVTSGSAEVLTICYTSKNQSAENHSHPTMRFVVRSRFDPEVQQEAVNVIDTLQASHRLFLHNEPDNESDHERGGDLGDPYPMDPVVPIQEADDGSLFDLLFDFDTDLDPDGMGGIVLPGGGTGAVSAPEGEDQPHTGIWTYNGFSSDTTLDGGELDIWVWHGAIADGVAAPELRIGFALDLVTGTGDLVTSIPVTPSEFTYGPSEDWVRVTTQFTVDDGGVPVQEIDHLRLRVWCASDAAVGDCHLAYDTNTYRSSLLVTEPTS